MMMTGIIGKTESRYEYGDLAVKISIAQNVICYVRRLTLTLVSYEPSLRGQYPLFRTLIFWRLRLWWPASTGR
jgi:hypothetical protein